jgi:hypothetical protein
VVRYCLWRDRKAVVTNALLVLGYALVLYVLARMAAGAITGSGWAPATLVPPGSVLYQLLFVNLFAFVARGAVKSWFVHALYGWRQALVSPARLLLANAISVAATWRAVRQYVRHKRTGEPLRWLKTTHAFPSFHVLAGGAPAPALAVAPALAIASADAGTGDREAELADREGPGEVFGEVFGEVPERRRRSAAGGMVVMQASSLPGGREGVNG